MKLDQYVGRIVRLRKYAFGEMTRLNSRWSVGMENCFLVAKVDHPLRKLTCYGENLRITVPVADVVLI